MTNKNSQWQVIDSGIQSPTRNMEMDLHFLQNICSYDHPILHFYDWQGPCATHGYFIDPSKYLNKNAIHKINLARRPTGGGIVFHLTDLAFSVVIPASHPAYSTNTLDNYSFVNTIVSQAIVQFKKDITPHLLAHESKSSQEECCQFCMAKPTIYDVVIDGKKVGGAAQRRTKDGFLHQGTISLLMPHDPLLKDVLQPQILDAMLQNSYPLIENISQLPEARKELRHLLHQGFAPWTATEGH